MKSYTRTLLAIVCFIIVSFVILPKSASATSVGFVTTWDTTKPGTSSSTAITIPVIGGRVYNYSVDWGDGNTSSGLSGATTHNYTTPGVYTVSITGTFPSIYFDNGGDKQKILTIEQWGNISWGTMQHAFEGASNLTSNATDTPNLSGVTDMSYMFHNAPNFNPSNIGTWNVSNVTLMNWLFYNDTSFNQNINSWDVSHVTDMSYMFGGTTPMAFNQPLNNWNVSSSTLMEWMFYGDSLFNQDISMWNVSHVTDMSYMFRNATVFNQNLSSWSTSNVTYMEYMFDQDVAFNQNLSAWNVASNYDMTGMFNGDTLSTANYDSMLIAWAGESVRSSVTFGAGNSTYCTGATARTNLISNHSWTIADGGGGCSVRYTAGSNGSISGSGLQFVAYGSNTSAVLAVANSGYVFSKWSDGSTQNPRVDINITGALNVVASFALARHNGVAAHVVLAPASVSGAPLDFTINNGIITTKNPVINLGLNGDPNTVKGYAVSLEPTFADTGIAPYEAGTPVVYQLPNFSGTYTLYVKYFSTTGDPSATISHVISLETLNGTTTNSIISNSKNVFTRVLKIGSKGSDVTDLQKFLIQDGDLVLPVNAAYGNFGKATQSALEKFQVKNVIVQQRGLGYGVFGSKTRAKINSLM